MGFQRFPLSTSVKFSDLLVVWANTLVWDGSNKNDYYYLLLSLTKLKKIQLCRFSLKGEGTRSTIVKTFRRCPYTPLPDQCGFDLHSRTTWSLVRLK